MFFLKNASVLKNKYTHSSRDSQKPKFAVWQKVFYYYKFADCGKKYFFALNLFKKL